MYTRKCELKEKLYFALRSKAEINDLSEKLLTKYLEQEKELQRLRAISSLEAKYIGNPNISFFEFMRKKRVRLCEKADGIFYFKLAP